MAFLQRVVNGGGFIDREYGVGRRRIDLLVRWPYAGEHGQHQWQREDRRHDRRDGHRSDDAPPIETAFEQARTAHDRAVTVLRA